MIAAIAWISWVGEWSSATEKAMDRRRPSLRTAGNTKHLRAISCLPGLHDLPISLPMPAAETFWNNQIERMTKSFSFGITENSLRGRIPQKYVPVGSCDDDCIARTPYQSLKVQWPAHRRHDEDIEIRKSLFTLPSTLPWNERSSLQTHFAIRDPLFDLCIRALTILSIMNYAIGSMR
jgi:hypothetical protein